MTVKLLAVAVSCVHPGEVSERGGGGRAIPEALARENRDVPEDKHVVVAGPTAKSAGARSK